MKKKKKNENSTDNAKTNRVDTIQSDEVFPAPRVTGKKEYAVVADRRFDHKNPGTRTGSILIT